MITISASFNAGSEIYNCFYEAIELAKKLNCCIKFQFNNVTCFAVPDGEAHEGQYNYHKAIKENKQHKFAHSKK